ncbi:MAG: hypothetical protein M1814_004558 [Vezdaea aestivalis]|nr:MAG: hypothetical protein M1814_004558 [Vezdaea aestivalis]
MNVMAGTLEQYSQGRLRPYGLQSQVNRVPQVAPPNPLLYQLPSSAAYGQHNATGRQSNYPYGTQLNNPGMNPYTGMMPSVHSFTPGPAIHQSAYGTGWIPQQQNPYLVYPPNLQAQPNFPNVAYQDSFGNRGGALVGQRNPQSHLLQGVQSGHSGSMNSGVQEPQQGIVAQRNELPSTQGAYTSTTSHSSVLRGPPRKPKLSGHALWVGNLPSGANILDLKEHFSKGAKNDIMSVFLMSSTNCAFVNYKTDAACAAALERFNEAPFHGTKLLCRYRRSGAAVSALSGNTTNPTKDPQNPAEVPLDTSTPEDVPTLDSKPIELDTEQASTERTRAEGDASQDDHLKKEEQLKSTLDLISSTESFKSAAKPKDRYFIMKSLTVEDLEQSAWNGIWATQSHNEASLNEAFQQSESVFLIFGANKTGEYFGYAKMISPISSDPNLALDWAAHPTTTDSTDIPRDIPTPETEFAPRGHVVDDRSRGTIFWEVEIEDLSDEEKDQRDASSDKSEAGEDDGPVSEPARGNPFKVEWISLTKVPFHQTRGLRNLWNANREIKIARDGTELETSVGRRVLQLFDRPQRSRVLQPGNVSLPYRTTPGHLSAPHRV